MNNPAMALFTSLADGLVNGLVDGFAAAGTHLQLLTAVLLIVLVSQFLMYGILKSIFEDKFSGDEYYSLSLAGWMLPACMLSLLWYFCSLLLTPKAGTLIAMIVVILLAFLVWARIRNPEAYDSQATIRSLFLLTLLFLILRLAFVSKAVLPSYFDSAQHYLRVKELLANPGASGQALPSLWSLTQYYHLGFHFLAAWITSLTHAQITDVMLVLGQILLALMPFSVFFLIKHETGSSSSAIFAVILAAFGWYMPAHAMDWGKYPALASIALFPFTFSLAYLTVKYRHALSPRNDWLLNTILLAAIAITVFLHSRSLIVFALLALTWTITFVWHKLHPIPKLIIFCLVVTGVIYEIAFIQTKGVLILVFDPYASNGLFTTAIVFFLSIFACKLYPRLVFSCMVITGLLLASLFIPLRDLIPGYVHTTLLDRPFVEMILYLPLTLLGGFGLAGLQQKLYDQKIVWKQIQPARYTGFLFCALVIIRAAYVYDLYPSDCCVLATSDDVVAIEWMDKNLPADARVLTASTDLNVLPTTEFQGSANGDAGAWINPITGRTSVPMIYYTDFGDPSTLDTLCQLQVGYIYVGTTGWTFDDSGMPALANGYRIVLALPNAKIYQVTGCG